MHQQLFRFPEAFCKHIRLDKACKADLQPPTCTPILHLMLLPHPDNTSPLSVFASVSPFLLEKGGSPACPHCSEVDFQKYNSFVSNLLYVLYQFTSTAINRVNRPRCVGDRRIQKEQFSGYERKRAGKLPKKGLMQVSTGGSALHHCGRKQLHVTGR